MFVLEDYKSLPFSICSPNMWNYQTYISNHPAVYINSNY